MGFHDVRVLGLFRDFGFRVSGLGLLFGHRAHREVHMEGDVGRFGMNQDPKPYTPKLSQGIFLNQGPHEGSLNKSKTPPQAKVNRKPGRSG